jgi:Ca-activated chloride channel homolog
MPHKLEIACILGLVLAAAPISPPMPADQTAETQTTIKVEVTLVVVPVIVTDAKGRYVPGLKEPEFHIFENGKEQKIAKLIPETDSFTVVLMVDTSGSTHFRIEEMQNAAIAFVEALRPQDRIMIVSFDQEAHFDADFTADRSRLRQSILGIQGEGGQTRLYDTLELVQQRLGGIPGRKAIILFSDGVDNGSRGADSGHTLQTSEKSDVVIYAVQYDTRKDGPPDRFQVPPLPGYVSFSQLYDWAVKYLRDLTGRSGGRVYRGDSVGALKEAFAQIAQELPRQYTICYYPDASPREGSYRSIRVAVDRPGLKIRARQGYRFSLDSNK